MALTALRQWKFVPDMGSSSHWGLMIVRRQKGIIRDVFYIFYKLLVQACQVSKMDWSVIIRGARPSAARDRPSEAREFARGVRGHAPPGKFWKSRCHFLHSEALETLFYTLYLDNLKPRFLLISHEIYKHIFLNSLICWYLLIARVRVSLGEVHCHSDHEMMRMSNLCYCRYYDMLTIVIGQFQCWLLTHYIMCVTVK